MELVILLAVFAAVVWYFFFRDKEPVKEVTSEAPYKVEDRPHVVDLFGVAVIDTVSSMTPPSTEAKTATPVTTTVYSAPTEKPKTKRAPRAKVESNATSKPKATAKPKAPTKPKVAPKPKATRAKPQV
jgi:outer membrane biosynthesis protein TonB